MPTSNGDGKTGVPSAERNFQDLTVAKQWIRVMGDVGDAYRKTIVNPIVAGLLEDIGEMELSLSGRRDFSDRESILYEVMARFLESACPHEKGKTLNPKLGWHIGPSEYEKWFKAAPNAKLATLKKLRVLDLGCGEGYRGRWLAPKGVEYQGADYSQPLYNHAKRQSNNGTAKFSLLDLRMQDPKDQSAALRQMLESKPQLVLAVTLLDHLDETSAVNLLRVLADACSRMPRCYLFVATCNPRYYKENARSPDNTRARVRIESLYSKSESGEVDVYLRSRAYYGDLFRDAGLLVLDQITPLAPEPFRPELSTHYDKGTGPFHCWLIQLHGRTRGELSLDDECIRALPAQSVGGKLVAELKQWGRESVGSITVRRETPIVGANNSGGNLFILLKGQASLASDNTAGNRMPRLPFLPGSAFGDLEASRNKSDASHIVRTLYRRTVLADQESLVAVIPEPDALKLLSGNTIEAELLQMLRSRLQSQVWLMDAKSGKFGVALKRDGSGKAAIEEDEGIDLRTLKGLTLGKGTPLGDNHLQACHYLAACLVGALECQRNMHPNMEPVVFVQDVARHVEGIGYTANQAEAAIRILVCAGVVYAAPLNWMKSFLTDVTSALEAGKLVHSTWAPWRGYEKYIKESQGRALPVFFLVEDEWALRQIASRPGYSLTRLLDNLLFLNGPLCSDNNNLVGIQPVEAFAGTTTFKDGTTFLDLVPTWRHRLARYQDSVLRFLVDVVLNRIGEDSLGFSVTKP